MRKLYIILTILLCYSHAVLMEKSQRTALFIAFPFIGHVNPLISQAIELEKRDWKTYVVSCSMLRDHVEKNHLEFIGIHKCHWMNDLKEVRQKIESSAGFASGIELFLSWSTEVYPHMYSEAVRSIQDRKLAKIDIGIIDMATLVGSDICETLNISCIVNNPDILTALRWFVLPPADYNPVTFLNNEMPIFGTDLLRRALLPVMRTYFSLKVLFQFDSRLNKLRQSVGLSKPRSSLTSYSNRVIIVNTAFGLEYNRLIPSNVHLTGPMLDMTRPKKSFINELSTEDREWIEFDSRPVVYVSTGTLVSFTNEQVSKLMTSLTSDRFRVVWRFIENAVRPINIPKTMRVVDYLSSTLGHLAHKNVKVFISHCGVNSAYESIWLGTPVICLPFFADQLDIGDQIDHAGVGIVLNRAVFTSAQLTSSIYSLLNNESYSINIQRVQAQIKLHGGVKRAADIIETVAQFGSDMFLSADKDYPMYAKYNLDIYFIWFLFIYVSTRMFRYLSNQFKSVPSSASKQKEKQN